MWPKLIMSLKNNNNNTRSECGFDDIDRNGAALQVHLRNKKIESTTTRAKRNDNGDGGPRLELVVRSREKGVLVHAEGGGHALVDRGHDGGDHFARRGGYRGRAVAVLKGLDLVAHLQPVREFDFPAMRAAEPTAGLPVAAAA